MTTEGDSTKRADGGVEPTVVRDGESESRTLTDDEMAYGEETATTQAPGSVTVIRTFVHREITTVILTPAYVALVLLMVIITGGTAFVGGGFEVGYLSTALDLLTPMQLLVPIVAVALAFGAIQGESRRGELAVFATYPVRSWELVTGIYLGRALGVASAVGLPLALLTVLIAFTDTPRLPMYATHTGVDSPVLYLRFVVLTLLFALVMVAIAIALSALSSTGRAAIAAAGVSLFALIIGFDLAVAFGFGGGFISDGALSSVLAASPLSAYRGLVFETAIVVADGTGPAFATPLVSLGALLAWGVGSLLIATAATR